MGLKSNKIFIVCFFIVLYLFSELVLPINSALSHNLYDYDIENECGESYEENQSDQIDTDENEVEEIDNDYFLDSAQMSEKQSCILSTDRLNLENLLSAFSQSCKTLQFIDNYQHQSIISYNSGTGNMLCALRTVILLN